MINAAIALVVDVIVMAVLLLATDLGVYTIVCAMIVYAVVMCVLNDRAMKKYMNYRNPWKKAYLPPLLASVPMGLVGGRRVLRPLSADSGEPDLSDFLHRSWGSGLFLCLYEGCRPHRGRIKRTARRQADDPAGPETSPDWVEKIFQKPVFFGQKEIPQEYLTYSQAFLWDFSFLLYYDTAEIRNSAFSSGFSGRCGEHQLDSVQLIDLAGARIVVDGYDVA